MIDNKYEIGDSAIFIEYNSNRQCFEVSKVTIQEIGICKKGISYYTEHSDVLNEDSLYSIEEGLKFLKNELTIKTKQ